MVGSPRQFFSPPGPPVRYGVVKNAVLPCGEPSAVIFTPPIFRCLSYVPQPLDRVGGEDLLEVGHERVGDDIDEVGAGGGRPLHQRQFRRRAWRPRGRA